MTMDTILEIPLALIDDSDRLREVDPAWAEALAENIGEFGLQNAIGVGAARPDGTHKLVHGAHRVAAFRSLGWKAIPARVFSGSDLDARMAEIDENLMRRELGPLERAIFLAERKRVYLARVPEAGQGKGRWKKDLDKRATMAGLKFSATVARQIGLSPRAIERDVQIFTALAPDVLRQLQDKQARLSLKLADLLHLGERGHDAQRAIIATMVERGCGFHAAVEVACGKKAPPEASEEAQFRALMAGWAKNPNPKARSRYLAEIAPKKKALAA